MEICFNFISNLHPLAMRILVCPDSFKECMPAKQVALHLAAGIRRVMTHADIMILPLADGGEGTVGSLVDATGGRIVRTRVHDPLMRLIPSFYGLLGDGKTAVIEMAAASGLELLEPQERNPLVTTTYGTGELIKNALDKGCRKIIVGVGGSATNDGGMGAAQAMGIRFLDKKGRDLAPGGGSLGDLDYIDVAGMDERMTESEICVASDVSNPLTGKNGASAVYGPQKGAGAAMAGRLDRNLRHFARQIEKQLGRDIERLPGGGAAGGLAAGMTAFFGAGIRPGFDVVSEITDLGKWMAWADLVITGEGKIDFQTQFGKTPVGVASLANRYQKPVIAVAGSLDKGYEALYEKGIHVLVSIMDKPMPLEQALKNAGNLLENTAERIFRLLSLGVPS